MKPTSQVAPHQAVAVTAPPARFVSRGGDKLAHALEVFGVDPDGLVCLDAGISTGGFTDCLLQRGAAHVTGVDVGYGQVAERVRTDPRVDVRERTNVRELAPDDLDRPPALVVCDVSFISLASVLPVLHALGRGTAALVALVKPQFEAARDEVGEGGVVRDPEVWRRVLEQVVDAGARLGWACAGVTASPLLGPAGNVEFLVHLVPVGAGEPAPGATEAPVAAMLDAAVTEGTARRQEDA
jgi:23S rRNA (cytidine1920-2'-O)/16S rRNA (cytidine1409-2'-O)-methyltransferase